MQRGTQYTKGTRPEEDENEPETSQDIYEEGVLNYDE
jgi:hypothetical protein